MMWNQVMRSIDKYRKVFICLFFLVYLIIGLNIHKDYGISWDELPCRSNYIKQLEYFCENNSYSHVMFYQTLLVRFEQFFKFTDPRDMFLMRHLVTFLIFYLAVIFFFRLCSYRFNSWKMGLLGSLFLILSPRIFAHSFYNPKDIPFLSCFVFAIYTLIRYLNKKTFLRGMIHAVTSILLINTHITGIFILLLTVFFVGIDIFRMRLKRMRVLPVIITLMIHIVVVVIVTFIFWNPFRFGLKTMDIFMLRMHALNRFEFDDPVLYMGRNIDPGKLAWHYNLVWMLMTIPPLYVILFLAAMAGIFKAILKHPLDFFFKRRDDVIFLLWFFVPLAAAFIFKSILYDGWRHHFFIYPAMLIFSLLGVKAIFIFLKKRSSGLYFRITNAGFVSFIVLSLFVTAFTIIRHHPYQNVYFNSLVGGIKGAEGRFELDYWGLSYRKGYEFILNNDKDRIIIVAVADHIGRSAIYMIPPNERKRLHIVNKPYINKPYVFREGEKVYVRRAKYIISNYRWNEGNYSYKECYSVKVDGVKIMSVYEL